MIPEAAVEAAARRIGPAVTVRDIITILEAAAPHMLAGAWDEGRKHGARFPYGERGLATDDNPYMTTKAATHGND